MAITHSAPHLKTYYTVVYEQPHVKTAKMIRRVTDYVDDLKWFRGRIERRGGRIISESGPRQVETIDVGWF